MKIQPKEIKLVGDWKDGSKGIVKDDVCLRIEWLISDHLEKLGSDDSGWDVLFRDPDDSRLWELIYPQSELQGGGPPCLRNISRNDAIAKYTNILDKI